MGQRDVDVATAWKRNELEAGLFLEQVVLNRPFRRQDPIVVVAQPVTKIQDAAYLNVRQGESFDLNPNTASSHQDLVEGLALERNHGAIGLHDPPADFSNREATSVVRQLYIRIFSAGFGQYLNSLIGGMEVIHVIRNFVTRQDDRECTGLFAPRP